MKDERAREDIEYINNELNNQIATLKGRLNTIEATLTDHVNKCKGISRREIEIQNSVGFIDKKVDDLERNMTMIKLDVHKATCEHKEKEIDIDTDGGHIFVCSRCGKQLEKVSASEFYKMRAVELVEELKQLNEKFKIETGEDMEI